MEDLKILNQGTVLNTNDIGVFNWLICNAKEFGNPVDVLETIKEIKNMCDAQHDFMLPEFKRYFGMDLKLYSEDFLTEKMFDNNMFCITINGKQNIVVEQIDIEREEEKKFNVVTVTVEQNIEVDIKVIVPEEYDNGDVDNLLNNNFMSDIERKIKNSEYDADIEYTDYSWSNPMTAKEIVKEDYYDYLNCDIIEEELDN